MHPIARIVLAAVVLPTTVLFAQSAASVAHTEAQPAAVQSVGANDAASPFVAIAPCRILDTRTQPPQNATQEAARDVNVQATRCRKVVPVYATVYSLRVATLRKNAATEAPVVSTRMVPVPAAGLLNFPIPPDSHVTVDVAGYHVAPGTPLGPSASTGGNAATDTSFARGGTPATNDVMGGTGGTVNTDGAETVGILLTPNHATPWVSARANATASDSGFYVAHPNGAAVMAVRKDGSVRLYGNSFFDGQSDFFGSATATRTNVAVVDNTVHNVQLVNPRDAGGGTTDSIVFYNAQTDDDRFSPAMTKYRAYTLGGYSGGATRLNYDSIFYEHLGTEHYHYRAWSASENKATFWLKALSVDPNGITQTRADMYVSGRVGIGAAAASPLHALDVTGHNASSAGTTAQLSSEVGAGSAWANQVNITNTRGAHGLILGYNGPGLVSPGDYHHPSGGHVVNVQNGPLTLGTSNLARMTIAASGAVGIGKLPASGLTLDVNGNANFSGTVTGGNIQAKYQDVAEWVPSTMDVPPGTVVILNPQKTNEVMPSATPYDTRVAGVVSAQPGLILGEAAATREMIATTGRVKVKVDARNAPIAVGDLLVTSDRPGTAMKSTPVDVAGIPLHRPGTILGKALEPLAGGEGEILVLLSLQ